MSVCSYLVVPEPGKGDAVRRRLAALPGCDVMPAVGHELLLLVAESPEGSEEQALHERIQALEGVQALALTFAEVTAP